jgi:hypothetical protein
MAEVYHFRIDTLILVRTDGERMFVVDGELGRPDDGSTLAFATGMPVSFVPSRDHAAKRMQPG